MKNRKFWRFLIVALVLAAVVVVGARVVLKKKKELSREPPPAASPLAVFTEPLVEGKLAQVHRYLGRLEAKIQAELSARITGAVLSVSVREGDAVKEGDVLVVLDSRVQRSRIRSLKVQLGAARTALASTRKIYERDRILYENKALGKEALDQSRVALDSARARVAELEALLEAAQVEYSYTRITAPFDGIVVRRFMDPGDTAFPGKPLLALVSTRDGYKVVADVPQEVFAHLRPGTPVILRPGLNRERKALSASISRVYPAGSSDYGLLPSVEIDQNSAPFGLPVGSSLHVEVQVREVRGFIVRSGSLLHRSSSRAVLFHVDEKNRVHPIPVEVLATNAERACVRGKLRPGMRVVVAGEDVLLRLHEGRIVHAVSRRNPAES